MIDAVPQTRAQSTRQSAWRDGMRKSDDPWERESRHDRQHSVSPDGYSTRDADLDREINARPSRWHMLRAWLFRMVPVALSIASAIFVLYLLATLLGLR